MVGVMMCGKVFGVVNSEFVFVVTISSVLFCARSVACC